MPLLPPPNFENDIQGKDTNLVPVVQFKKIIDGSPVRISISTNSFTEAGGHHWLPLLLNVPSLSLKESIDIEKRNYKISNVTLNISNYEYNGQRFSDLLTDTYDSAINTECRIFWTSPSTTTLLEEGSSNPARAMLIYNGTIRRYTHDDEKVTLTIEDQSQAKLHKDLPLTDVGSEDIVPDKYKNKYIPIVYGHVERSPLMPDYHRIQAEPELVLELRLKADTEGILSFKESTQNAGADTPYPVSALYYFGDNTYWNIAQQSLNEAVNFVYNEDTAHIRLDTDTEPEADDGENLNNDFSKGRMGIYVIRKIKDIETMHYESNDPEGDLYFHNVSGALKKITGWIDIYSSYTYQGSSFTGIDWSAAWLKCNLDDVTRPSQLATDEEGDDLDVETKVHLDIIHYNFSNTENTPDGNTPNDATDLEYTKWRVWEQGIGVNNESVNFGLGDDDTFAYDYNSITGSDIGIDFSKKAINAHQYFNVGIPQHRYTPGPDRNIKANFTLNDAFLVHTLFVDGIIDKDYYANIIGRIENPTAPQVIKDIMETELGVSGIIDDTSYSAYASWIYEFTVHEKINSKKLLEGLASASPYIPRFDNMGTFHFEVIKDKYTGSPDHVIEEAEVIDYSFSRTDIEQVYTKIELKYNWDYAREEFLSSFTWNIEQAITAGDMGSYDRGYYGFPKNSAGNYEAIEDIYDPDADSTLVIDDDRGKYIRDQATAENFTKWMLYWHMNSHLKLKVKLPLKSLIMSVGDIVKFDEVIGDVFPYGINYKTGTSDLPGGKAIYPRFMILSTNKTLEYCEVECIQMHDLSSSMDVIYGCMDEAACNYNPGATVSDEDCNYGSIYYEDTDGDGLGSGNPTLLCPEGSTGGTILPDTGWVTNSDDACPQDTGSGELMDCAGNCPSDPGYLGAGDYGIDDCGTCNGDNSSCADCNGVPNGNAIICPDESCVASIDDCYTCADETVDDNYTLNYLTLNGEGCVAWTDFLVPGCPFEYHPAFFGTEDPEIIDWALNFVPDPTTNLPPDPDADHVFIIDNPDDPDQVGPNSPLALYWVEYIGSDDLVVPQVYYLSNCQWQDTIPHKINNTWVKIAKEGVPGTSIFTSEEMLWDTTNAQHDVVINIDIPITAELIEEYQKEDDNSNINQFSFTFVQDYYKEVPPTGETPTFGASGDILQGTAIQGLGYEVYEFDVDNIVEASVQGIESAFDAYYTMYRQIKLEIPGLTEYLGSDPQTCDFIEHPIPFYLYIPDISYPDGTVYKEITMTLNLHFVPLTDSNGEACATHEDVPEAGCSVALGDLNGDGGVNGLDVVALVQCVLHGECGGNECAADINGDGGINGLDIVALVNMVLG